MSAINSEQVAAFNDLACKGIHIRYYAGVWLVKCQGQRGLGPSPEAAALACKSAMKWAEIGGADKEAADDINSEPVDQSFDDPMPVALR